MELSYLFLDLGRIISVWKKYFSARGISEVSKKSKSSKFSFEICGAAEQANTLNTMKIKHTIFFIRAL